MNLKTLLLIISIYFFCLPNSHSQTVFDRIEDWLKEHHFQLSYSLQESWYKKSHIRLVQSRYQRDIIFQEVRAKQNKKFNSILDNGELGVPQYKVFVGVELSDKYAVGLTILHLNYIVNVERDYYRLGTWNGEFVAEDFAFSSDFKKLEHSNGINIWSIGLKRMIKWNDVDQASWGLNLEFMPSIGYVLTATQAEIRNPDGIFEHYDPGNNLAGVCFGGETKLALILWKQFILFVDINYFQMILKKAKFEKDAYVEQDIRGFNWGFGIGYKF